MEPLHVSACLQSVVVQRGCPFSLYKNQGSNPTSPKHRRLQTTRLKVTYSDQRLLRQSAGADPRPAPPGSCSRWGSSFRSGRTWQNVIQPSVSTWGGSFFSGYPPVSLWLLRGTPPNKYNSHHHVGGFPQKEKPHPKEEATKKQERKKETPP